MEEIEILQSDRETKIPYGFRGEKISIADLVETKEFQSLHPTFALNVLRMIRENPSIGILKGGGDRPEEEVRNLFYKNYKPLAKSISFEEYDTNPKRYSQIKNGAIKWNPEDERWYKRVGKTVAVPGASWHTGGFAVDLTGNTSLAGRVAKNYNIEQITGTGEQHHFQPSGVPTSKRMYQLIKERFGVDAIDTPLPKEIVAWVDSEIASNVPRHPERVMKKLETLVTSWKESGSFPQPQYVKNDGSVDVKTKWVESRVTPSTQPPPKSTTTTVPPPTTTTSTTTSVPRTTTTTAAPTTTSAPSSTAPRQTTTTEPEQTTTTSPRGSASAQTSRNPRSDSTMAPRQTSTSTSTSTTQPPSTSTTTPSPTTTTPANPFGGGFQPGSSAGQQQTAGESPLGVEGRRVYNPATGKYTYSGYKATKTLPSGQVQEIEPQYFQEDVDKLSSKSRAFISGWQNRMNAAGLLGNTFANGVVDNQTKSAYTEVLDVANREGVTADEALKLLAQNKVKLGSGSVPRYQLTNPQDIRAVIKSSAQATIGRNLGEGDLNRLVALFQQKELQAQKQYEVGGVVEQAPSAQQFAISQIEQDFGQEVNTQKLSNVFSSIDALLRKGK